MKLSRILIVIYACMMSFFLGFAFADHLRTQQCLDVIDTIKP